MRLLTIAALCLAGNLPLTTWSAATETHSTTVYKLSDTALTNFVQSVVSANPRVQAARAALDASTAYQSAAARPLYNPSLEFGAENATEDTRTIGISHTFDWSGKRSARSAVADFDRLGVEAAYFATWQALSVELLSGLAAYQTGVERGRLAKERVNLMRDFADLAKRRYNAGDMTQVELNLASLIYSDALMQRATVASGLSQARSQVSAITPLSTMVNQWPALNADLPTLPISSDQQALLLALPNVRLAQRRVESANALIALREKEKRLDPTVSIRGGEEGEKTLVGLDISMPIPIRNSFSYEVTAARAEHQQAQQLSDDVLRRAHARLVSASERYQFAHTAWQEWREAGLSSLQQQGEQLRRLWESGELSTTEYLVQIGQTIDTQGNSLNLRLTLWDAWFEWLAASGQVNEWLQTHSNNKD